VDWFDFIIGGRSSSSDCLCFDNDCLDVGTGCAGFVAGGRD
jgi:hypothetical protein